MLTFPSNDKQKALNLRFMSNTPRGTLEAEVSLGTQPARSGGIRTSAAYTQFKSHHPVFQAIHNLKPFTIQSLTHVLKGNPISPAGWFGFSVSTQTTLLLSSANIHALQKTRLHVPFKAQLAKLKLRGTLPTYTVYMYRDFLMWNYFLKNYHILVHQHATVIHLYDFSSTSHSWSLFYPSRFLVKQKWVFPWLVAFTLTGTVILSKSLMSSSKVVQSISSLVIMWGTLSYKRSCSKTNCWWFTFHILIHYKQYSQSSLILPTQP